VRAIVVVGSVARGDARPDSDIDVVLLTSDPARYLEDSRWISDFGSVHRVEFEDYGKVTSVRVVYGRDLEVEFGIAAADWAVTPLDPGTEAVARNGIITLMDRDGDATALADRLGSSSASLRQSGREPRG
jgi:predicted nucleotidyltransferase